MVDREFRKLRPLTCAVLTSHSHIARMLVQAGHDLSQEKYLWTNEDVPKQLVLNVELWGWLRDAVSRPMRLAHLSKLTVRRFLGTNLQSKLMNMEIPVVLKRYLTEIC